MSNDYLSSLTKQQRRNKVNMKRLHRGNKDHIDDSANIEKMQMKMLKE